MSTAQQSQRRSRMFTLAHITDLHMGPMPLFGPSHWNVKRLLGTINWYKGRRKAHQQHVLDALTRDLADQAPDHIAVTGDLVNVGLPQEHIRALAWLTRLGDPCLVSVVPGNHDIYTKLRGDHGTLRWQDYMSNFDRTLGEGVNGEGDKLRVNGECVGAVDECGKLRCEQSNHRFPYLRRLGQEPGPGQGSGGIALIGLNSAIPTRPFMAIGRIGIAQLQRLADLLAQTERQGLTRIVLIHHPPLLGQSKPSHALTDAAALQAILDSHGAELVLHGHEHINSIQWRSWRDKKAGLVRSLPVIGTASASMAHRHKGEPLARYNLYRFEVDQDRPSQIEMIGRGFAEPGGAIVELERRMLSLSAVTQEARMARWPQEASA